MIVHSPNGVVRWSESPMKQSDLGVVAELRGGLGNQLFQYAAAQSTASRCGGVARFLTRQDFATSDLARFLGESPGGASLQDCLAVGYVPPSAGRLARIRAHVARRFYGVNSIHQREDGQEAFAALPDSFSFKRPVGLFGYFQHPSWYESVLADMIDRIITNAPDSRLWLRPDAVAIHYRRGDYVRFGWDLPLMYYEIAMARLGLIPPAEITVVADDHVFQVMVEDHFQHRGFRVQVREPMQDDDFWATAGAGSVIMSNSTYCWWATVVGDRLALRRDRRVVFPQGWLKGSGDKLRRDTWISLPSSIA